jgi:predicted lactoylglutathione lyase
VFTPWTEDDGKMGRLLNLICNLKEIEKHCMKTKRIWANLAVNNIKQTTNFYTELGFKPYGPPTIEICSFIFGEDNFVINFFIKDKLKSGLKGELSDLTKGNEIIFTLSAESKEEVDDWARGVQKAGGTLISKPEEFGEGYYGFVFADPDGHRFNVFLM